MYRLCILLLFNLFALTASAQRHELPATMYEEERQRLEARALKLPIHYIAISTGAVFPQGSFSTIGHAKAGFSLDIDLSYRLHNNWCAGLTYKLLVNPVDKGATYWATIPWLLHFPEETLAIKNDSMINNYHWTNQLLAIGGGMSFIEKKITFDMRLMSGLLYSLGQAHYVSGVCQVNQSKDMSFDFWDSKSSALSPVVVVSFALSYPIKGRLAAFVKGDYVGSVVHSNFGYTATTEQYSIQSNGTRTQSIQTFGISFGIKYDWGKIRFIE